MKFIVRLRAYLTANRQRMLLAAFSGIAVFTAAGTVLGHVLLKAGAPHWITTVVGLVLQFGFLIGYFWFVKPLWSGATPALGGATSRDVSGRTWASRLFLASDRYYAWLYGSRSEIRQDDIDSLDQLLLSWRGRAVVLGWFAFFMLPLYLLFCVNVTRFKVDLDWHWQAASFLPLVTGAVIAFVVGWLVIDLWVGFRKYIGRMKQFTLIMLGVMLLAMAAPMFGFWLAKPEQLTKLATTAVIALLIGGVATVIIIGITALVAHRRNRDFQVSIDHLQLVATQAETGRALAEAQLKLLQAQIEPHFLFNTLGALQHRAEGKAPEAAALAADLIRFLRGSMENLRAERTTLGEDFKMLGAYLGVMQARLGNRLSYRLELPDTLASQVIPTMMLLTLVENALKHGIEPHPPGGEVSVVAVAIVGGIQITVADTGRGVSDLPGSGVGLDNIRTRLQMLYGKKARLDLSENTPQGFIATLTLPLVAQAA